jgi:tetratricopeptide (TPR) repeat protein
MNKHYERGQILTEQGRYEPAIQELQQALAIEPDLAWAHGYLALCLEHQQRYPEALAAVESAIGLDPEDARFHYYHARILFSRYSALQAEDAINQALALDPEDADYYSLRSQIYLEQKQYQQALSSAEQGLAINAEHQGCKEARLSALSWVRPFQYSEIQAEAQQLLASTPESPGLHIIYAWACLYQYKVALAEDHYRTALKLSPNNEQAKFGLIEALKAHYPAYRLLLRFRLLRSKTVSPILRVLRRLPLMGCLLAFLQLLIIVVGELSFRPILRIEHTLPNCLFSFSKQAKLVLTPTEILLARVKLARAFASNLGIALAIQSRQLAWLLIFPMSTLLYLLWWHRHPDSKARK